ncbi:MAG: tetratricopeptide repeat protein, partial [Chloroflexota bacterium]
MYTQTRMILLFCLSITLMGCITQIDPALPHTSLPEIESVLDVDLLLSPSHPQSKINNNAVQSGERVQVVGTDTDGGWFLVHHNNQVGWMHLLHSRNFMGNFKPAMVIDPLTADCSDYLDTSTDMETTWHSTTQGDVIMQGSILYDPTETSFRTAWLSLDIQGVGEVVQSDYVHVPLTHSTTGTTNTTSIILFSFWLKNLNTTSTLAFDLTGVTGPLGSFQVAYFSSHCDYRFGDLDLIFTQQLPIAITKTAFGKVEPITMPAENSIANMLPISTLVNLLQFDQTATQSQHTKEYTKTGETTETPSAVLEIVLNPVQVEDPQLQAFVEGTRLFGEGERLEEADDIEGARQNWLAAVAAYERADEFIYVADLHLRIANSYYPESLRCLAGIATATANATENTTDPLAAFDCLNNLSLVEMMQLQTAMDNNRVQMIIQHNFAALDASTRVYETLIRKGMPDAYDPDVLARADALYRQGQEHFDAGNCQQAEPKLRQARELYQSEEFGSGEARALVLIAVCQYQNQSLFNPLDILDTLTTLLEVYAITATLPLGSPITERYLEANQLFEEKNWQAAQDIYKEVFEHHQATGNTAKMPPVMNQIGNTYVELNQFVEAERWYKDTLAILRTFRANPDPYHQAAVYHNLGAIFLQMGKYHETIPELSQAIELWQKLGQPINEVRSLIGLGTALRIQGDYENALLVLQETQKRYQNIPPDANIESALLLGFAQIAYVQGQYEESLAWIEQAVALQPYLSSDLDKLLTLNFMAVMHTEAGAFDDALSLYAEIIAWAEQTNQPLFVAYTQIYMGTTYARQGSYQEAINAYLQALTFFEEVDLTPPQALIHYQLGVTYLLFNDLEKAEHHFFEALPLFEAMNRIEEIAMIQLGIGAFYINVGDFNQAQDVLEEGLGHWESIDNPAGLSATLSLLALSSLGQHDYEQAIQHSLAALESSEQTGALLQQEVNFLLLTVAYFLAGDESVTAEHIQKIQTNPDTIDNPYLTLLKTSLLAIVHLKNGAPNIAYTYIQEAIEHLEQAQRQLTIPEFKMSEFNGFVDIYKIAMTIALATGQDAQGLYHAEQSMARGFLEQIGNHRIQTNDADDTALIQKEQDLRQEIAGLHAELDNTTMLGATTAITASINLEQAYQAYEDVQVALKLANPEYASLRSVNVSTLSEIKTEILDAETTLILYYVYAQDLSNRHLYHHNIHDPANQIFAWVIEKNHAE